MEKKQNNEFATAARSIIFSEAQPEEDTKVGSENEDGDAIDDTCDADEDVVQAQRNISQLRVQKRNSEAGLLPKVVPFHWAPMLSPLTETDVETCITLENAALSDPTQRPTREKIEYRVRKASGVCYGLFNSCKLGDAKDWWIETMRHCRPVESSRSDGTKHVMFAHIIATLGKHPVVTKEDMAYPEDWRKPTSDRASSLGHQSSGQTLCLHSFAVCPGVQGVGIGKTAMKSYLQLMNESGMAERIALICKPYSIEFYQRFGFKDMGLSEEVPAGENWHNMVLELSGPKKKTKEEPTKPGKSS